MLQFHNNQFFIFSHGCWAEKYHRYCISHLSNQANPADSQYTQKRCSRTLNLFFVVTSCIHKHEIYWFPFGKRNSGHWLIVVCGHTKFKTNNATVLGFISHFRLNWKYPEHNNSRRLFSVIAKLNKLHTPYKITISTEIWDSRSEIRNRFELGKANELNSHSHEHK